MNGWFVAAIVVAAIGVLAIAYEEGKKAGRRKSGSELTAGRPVSERLANGADHVVNTVGSGRGGLPALESVGVVGQGLGNDL